MIVIDGGSSDGTVEYLREHGHVVDHWLSEPDCGIYDAMNKGIALARGTYLLHLNAGDSLVRFPKAELEQAKRDGIDVVAFRVALDGRREFRPFDANQKLAKSGARMRIYNTVVAHHATDGVSNQNTARAVSEFFAVIANNYGRLALPVAWMMCKWDGLKRRLRRG